MSNPDVSEDIYPRSFIQLAVDAANGAAPWGREFICTPDMAEAMLDALAPRLKAEGLREAARMVNPDKYPTSNYAGLWEYRILARADALDPPKETK